MVLSWSTPERRRGNERLPIIPNELYLEIFDHITPDGGRLSPSTVKDLSNLALVCRYFCYAMLPRIFKSITFSGGSAENAHCSGTNPKLAWCRQINESKEPARSIAHYVKECRFICWLGPQQSWVHNGFFSLYAKAVSRMPNIESMAFHDSIVKEAHGHVLDRAENIKNLVFNHCTLSTDFKPRKKSVMKLKLITSRLILRSKDFAHAFATPSLRCLKTDSIEVALWVVALLDEPTLEELHLRDIDNRDIPMLHNILEKAPGITQLSIWSSASIWPQLKLTSTLLPNIKSLRLKIPDTHLLSATGTKQAILDICRTLGPHSNLQKLQIVGSGSSSRIGSDIVTWELLVELATSSLSKAFPNISYLRVCEKLLKSESKCWGWFDYYDTI
ncbi:hypothetical protein BJ138DRAFT_1130422 [Hygrophoropsis aurantiaca]|uniref:Uncharacterized protein n=1 Tax=Hygrophoropsis aurantiaca TaxID=72124 RepID=A0ACB7ZXP4_9AGAM|nr:hypothetical protein BJ138DRAFT_1130422 [Hygrophoropsis aurantiaca]